MIENESKGDDILRNGKQISGKCLFCFFCYLEEKSFFSGFPCIIKMNDSIWTNDFQDVSGRMLMNISRTKSCTNDT
jgi:hypothetical protein